MLQPRTTAGNPFLLRELVKELEEAGIAPLAANVARVGSLGAQRVADAVLRRLARLSPRAPELARAMASLGDEATVADAATLADLDLPSAIGVIGAMRAGELLGDAARLTFAHPIIRSAIYHSILPAERMVRHGRAARVLHEGGAPAEQVAAQILLADGVAEPWMLEQLRLAAGSALAMGAPRSAASYLRRALALEQGQSDRAALLAQLGHAEVLAGLPEAADHLEDAVRLTSDPDERARVAIVLAQLLKYTGRVPRAVELLSELPTMTDPTLRERVETEMLSGALMSDAAHTLLAARLEQLEDQRTPAQLERERIELVVLAFERMNANHPKGELLDLLARAGPGPDSPTTGCCCHPP